MNAILPIAPLTVSSMFPLPALNPVQRTIPALPATEQLTDELTLSQSETGLIVWQNHNPIAWIYPGYHEGQQDNHPKRCDFVDVAYHRQTQRGVNLETADFFTLPEALQFVADTFGGGEQ